MGHFRRRSSAIAVISALLLAPLAAVPAHAEPADPGCTGPIRRASVMKVENCDTSQRIIRKASKIVPRESQVAWQKKELTAFTHFGMNTFTDREWGSGAESEKTFDPKRVDVDQWMRTYKAMGAKQVMLTAKHHDGFVLYPTRYSNHSVIASPWWVKGCAGDQVTSARKRAEHDRNDDPSAYWQARDAGDCANPGGDILGRYVQAARKAGLKVGVYLSPADGSELPHAWHAKYVKKIQAKADAGKTLSIEEKATLEDGDRAPSGQGRYGAGSEVTTRTIPTLVKNDDRAAAVKSGKLPSFTVQADDYDAYYLNQLYELFTQYGSIDELWLDGANPWSSAGITQKYDFTSWFKLIKKLSPKTVTFAGPQGVRWVGNENGTARRTEWSVTPATAAPSSSHNEGLLPDGASAPDIGSRSKITDPRVKYLQWFPAESDARSRDGWFYHADEKPKSARQMVQMYDRSVGRNSVLLLNVAPSKKGIIPADDVAELTAFGDAVKRTYAHNRLRPHGKVQRKLADRALSTAWSPARGATTGSVTVHPTPNRGFDRIRLGEDIRRGQQVEKFAVDAFEHGGWRTVASGTTIGYSRILKLDEPITASRLRVRVTQARGTPRLSTVGLYRTTAPR